MSTIHTFHFGSHAIRVASTPSGSFFHAQDVCNALSLELPATNRTGAFDGVRVPVLSAEEAAELGVENVEFSAWLTEDVMPQVERQTWAAKVAASPLGKKGTIVPGSAAAQFGGVLRLMPALRQDWQHPDSCPVLKWIADKCEVSLEQAKRVFNLIRRREDILVFIKPHWMGVQTMKLGAAMHFATKGGAESRERRAGTLLTP